MAEQGSAKRRSRNARKAEKLAEKRANHKEKVKAHKHERKQKSKHKQGKRDR